jgi:transcription-repair coupling factor (superfamily II helicase)
MKLLDQSVRELRGEPVEEELDPVVTVEAAAYLPEHYVAEAGQRLALYKRLAGVRSDAELAEVRAELADRFGPLPGAAEQLLDVVDLRLQAKRLRVEKVEARGGRAVLTFAGGPTPTSVTPDRLVAFLRRHGKRVRLVRDFVLEATVPAGSWRETYGALVGLMRELG